MGLLVLFLAGGVSAASAATPLEMPDWLSKGLAAVDDAMGTVEAGRRLAAGVAGVPVEPGRLAPELPPVAYRPGEQPLIIVDPARLRDFKALDFELAVARARARARRDGGVPLLELEQAAEQDVLDYVLERARISPEIEVPLRRAMAEARRVENARQEDAAAGGVSPAIRLPTREPQRLAELLRRFLDEPEEFYWTIEREVGRTDSLVRLSELEGFLWAYSERLDRAVCPPPGRYCKLEGRFLPPALVPAARAALAAGGLDRVREPLAGFESAQAQALRAKIAAWLNGKR